MKNKYLIDYEITFVNENLPYVCREILFMNINTYIDTTIKPIDKWTDRESLKLLLEMYHYLWAQRSFSVNIIGIKRII